MTIKEWAEKIHENAVNHGFWENEKSFAEIVALCHSELSEALEEDRAGKPLIYMQDGKPEGKAVEMADCIIRILDWMGKENIDAEDVIATKHDYNTKRPYRHGKKILKEGAEMGYLIAFGIGFVIGGFLMSAFTDDEDCHDNWRD